ncbi:MAG: glycosyltransferase [Candidatus Absconditabacterales bacterium]
MQKKLRIAIVCDSIDDSSLGGSFISGERFGAGLAKKGHEIIRITSKFKEIERKKDFAYAKMYEFPHLPRIGTYGVCFAYTSAARLCKIFQKEKIDIIYSIHPSIIAWQAIRAAKRLRIPIISHSHVWPELLLPGAPHVIQKFIKKVIAGMYRRCDGIISPTAFTKKIFDDCSLQNQQVIISNGVDTSIFCPSLGVKKNMFTILYTGRLDQEKNIPFLLEALHLLKKQKKLLPNMRCVLVGGGSEEKKLRTMVTEYGLDALVDFVSKMPSISLVQFYQEASVFVLPSLYELESMVTLEAMACGCPLLISDSPTSAAKDFVHNNGYTFNPKNPQDFADKIYSLSTNPELCKLMGKISSEQAQKFSFTLSVQKLESFLLSFIRA